MAERENSIKISDEQKQRLISLTVASLGYNPSARGYSAETIQKHLYQVIAGLQGHIDSEDDNLVNFINACLNDIQDEYKDLIEELTNSVAVDIANLKDYTDGKIDDVNGAISDVAENLAQEIVDRTNDVNSERTARAAAINEEASSRQSADNSEATTRATNDALTLASAKDYADLKISPVAEKASANETAIEGLDNRIDDLETIKYGATISAVYNSSTGVITIALKDQDGSTLATASVDLPMELLISNASYNSENHIITLTLANGNTLSVDVADLVDTYTADGSTLALSSGTFSISSAYKAKIDEAYAAKHTHANKSALDAIESTEQLQMSEITIDSSATQDSNNLISSGAVYSAIAVLINAIADKQDLIDTIHKLSSDLVTDVDKINKFVTASEKSAWNGKADPATLAPAYSSSSTYDVGDIVTYNGNIYKCNTAISTAEEWDSSHWTRKTVGELLNELDLSDFVTLSTTQTITGTKTFSQQIIASKIGQILTYISMGDNNYPMLLHNPYMGVRVKGDLCPETNSTYGLGTSSNKWWNLYLSGSLRDGTNSISIADIANKNDIALIYEKTANKVTSISSSSTDTEYPSAKAVYTYGEGIRAVAEGKCKSYTISDVTNSSFNSQSASLSGITSFVDTAGNTINTSSLKNGDVVLVIETDVPDRWYSSSDSKFYILETAKVDLSGYLQKQTGITTSPQAYIKNADGTHTMINVRSGVEAAAIVRRDNNGEIELPLTPVSNSSATPKKYVDDRQTNIAPAYSSNSTYAVGDYVTYNGTLYKCTTDILSAEAWNSTHWTATDVVSNLGGGGGGSATVEDLVANGTVTLDVLLTDGNGNPTSSVLKYGNVVVIDITMQRSENFEIPSTLIENVPTPKQVLGVYSSNFAYQLGQGLTTPYGQEGWVYLNPTGSQCNLDLLNQGARHNFWHGHIVYICE